MIGRWTVVDALADEDEQIDKSPYAYGWNNPVNLTDPDGNCPNCLTGLVGAIGGGLIGGGIELVSQLATSGKVTNWRAVGGSAVQGAVVGGVAGLTGGASLTTLAAANVTGGAASNVVQGKAITVQSVATDAATGYAAGAASKIISKAANSIATKLVNSSAKSATTVAVEATSNSSANSTLKPGPYASRSVPARSKAQVFTTADRNAVNAIGQETGCHTCGVKTPGTKSGNFVPDHQPVSALVPNGTPQQLYPQCIGCSRTQGGVTSSIIKKQNQ